jgi:toxin ParE1/3/4
MRVIITQPASDDLTDIGLHISKDNPAAALGLIEQLLDGCQSLADYPLSYPETGVMGLRKRPHGAYLIFYRVSDRIEIARILHAARDWARLLDPATD